MARRSYRWFRARLEGLSANSAFVAVLSQRKDKPPERVVDSDEALERFLKS